MSKLNLLKRAAKTVKKVKKFLTARRGLNFKPLTRTRGQKAKRLLRTALTSHRKKLRFSVKSIKSRFARRGGPSNKQIVAARKRLAKNSAVGGASASAVGGGVFVGRKKFRSRR